MDSQSVFPTSVKWIFFFFFNKMLSKWKLCSLIPSGIHYFGTSRVPPSNFQFSFHPCPSVGRILWTDGETWMECKQPSYLIPKLTQNQQGTAWITLHKSWPWSFKSGFFQLGPWPSGRGKKRTGLGRTSVATKKLNFSSHVWASAFLIHYVYC